MPPPIHLLLLYAAHQLMLYVRVYFSRSSSQMYYFGKYMPRLAAELRRRSKLIGPWFISKKIAAAAPTQASAMNIPIMLRFYVTKPLSNLYEFQSTEMCVNNHLLRSMEDNSLHDESAADKRLQLNFEIISLAAAMVED